MASTDSDPGPESGRRGLSRRDVLILGGGAVVGAAAVGAGFGLAGSLAKPTDGQSAVAATEAPAAAPADVRRYVSTTLTAPNVTTWTKEGTTASDGLLFASPRAAMNNGLIFQTNSEPVWIEPEGQNVADMRVQQYLGQPVLTYWEGTIVDGWGIGVGVIKDTSYRTVATVRAGNGLTVDLHEFILTPRGTALILAYPVEPLDLTRIDGPSEGWVLGGRVQEIDVATGNVLFDWNVLNHVDVTESYQKLSSDGDSAETPFDPVHLNSIEEVGDTLLLSARHTHALYSVDRATGEILWRLGGKKSDFEVDEDAAFTNQHDARRHADGRVSLFDNHGQVGAEAVSAGLLLEVDESARTARLSQKFDYRDRFGGAMGNLQVLSNGNVLVGWGTAPAATEFSADGTAIFEARDLGNGSYRVFRQAWSATPGTKPDIGVRRSASEMTVYASWNGATDVAGWRVLTGADSSVLSEAAVVERTGFETSTAVAAAPTVVVEALDAGGAVLGASNPLTT